MFMRKRLLPNFTDSLEGSGFEEALSIFSGLTFAVPTGAALSRRQ